MKKTIAVSMALTLILTIASSATVFAADKPVVTNGASTVYEDKGASRILAPKDVTVGSQPSAAYYYRIGNMVSVDVFYDGAADQLLGSYFNGPLTGNTHVSTIYPGFRTDFGTRLDPDGDQKITIPAIAGQPTTLYIVAYEGEQASELYSHTFYTLAAALADGKITAAVVSDKAENAEFYLYAAVYNAADGKLVHIEKSDLYNGSAEHIFDVNAYTDGNYTFKVFCWQSDYLPMYEAAPLTGASVAVPLKGVVGE